MSTDRGDFQAFLTWAAPRLGLRVAGYRNVGGTVRKRVSRRMAELGLASLVEYRERLERDADEWAELDASCRIPISRVYRDAAVCERVGRVILPMHAERASREGRAVQAWSAGCASGEEPYTLGILWEEFVRPRWPDVGFSILATDIDASMLARARAGTYGEGSLRELPLAMRGRAFDGDSVRPELRRYVTFETNDLRSEAPSGPFDLLLCRNVLFTYVDEALQPAIVDRMTSRLRPGGHFVVGSLEAPSPAALRSLVAVEPCIFERPPSSALGRP